MSGLHRNLKTGEILQIIAPKGDKMQLATDEATESAIDVSLVQKSGNYVALEIIAHRSIKIRVIHGADDAAPKSVGG